MKRPVLFRLGIALAVALIVPGCFIPLGRDRAIWLGGDRFSQERKEIKRSYERGEISKDKYRKRIDQVRFDKWDYEFDKRLRERE